MSDDTPEQQPQLHSFGVLAECEIADEELAYFALIVRELAGLLNQEALVSLRQVTVVEHSQVAPKANALIRTVDARRSYFPEGALGPEGIALPLEQDGRLESFVVIAREVAESLSRPVRVRSPNAISTILEELLHVCVYGLAKSRRGYVHPDQTSRLACEVDLHVIASQMCDEYVVNRLKTRIIRNLPLVQAEPDGPLTVGELRYGAVPLALVCQGLERLSLVLRHGRSGVLAPSEAWPMVTRILYRNFFEPLARYSAYVDDLGPSGLDEELLTSDGYQGILRAHWLKTHAGLQRLVSSDLADTENVLEEVVSTLRVLLQEVGVTYGGRAAECWVRFSDPPS